MSPHQRGRAQNGIRVLVTFVYNSHLLPFAHESVNHFVPEYVRDMTYTYGIESFWEVVQRRWHGVYHKMLCKHLDKCFRYVNLIAGNGLYRGTW